MLVQRGQAQEDSVFGPESRLDKWVGELRYKANYLPLWRRYFLEDQPGLFSPTWVPDRLSARTHELSPDILHLHWTAGFIRPEAIGEIDTPLVWTLHDMWPFTGGCHYAGGCQQYQHRCGECPVLGSTTENDRSRSLWNRKQTAWEDQEFTVVTPSTWMEAKARESSLFKSSNIVTIPNGLDLERYRPVDGEQARKTLSIETDDELILFTSADSTLRKGGHHLRTALDQLTLDPASHSLVVFGDVGDKLKDTEYDVYELGYIDSSAVPLAYSAADVTVIPSEQDNLPNTGLESLACGTPCVAFEIGGIPDIIESGRNGYLASPFDAGALAEGIETVIENKKQLSENARTTAENRFDITNTAQEYIQLYRSIL